jgi:hypothetical protein
VVRTDEEQPYVSVEEIQVYLIQQGIPSDPAYLMARQERRIWELEAQLKETVSTLDRLIAIVEAMQPRPPDAA